MGIKFDATITGEFIILRKVELSDAQDIFIWRSGRSGRFLRHPEGYNVSMQEAWIKSRSDKEINYIIQDIKTLKKVGMISIYEVNTDDKVAEVGRLLLSDIYLTKSNPYGLEALFLAYNYVFNVMNFRKVTGVIAAVNFSMVKLQLFLGMKQEGYLEKHTFINGDYEDLHILSLFKNQFAKIYTTKINFLLKSFK
uniref:GNAT family N-acetyltransferase n=1 Tax=Algoriphagus sp. TaxID=1872435 RepID=UPI004047C801